MLAPTDSSQSIQHNTIHHNQAPSTVPPPIMLDGSPTPPSHANSDKQDPPADAEPSTTPKAPAATAPVPANTGAAAAGDAAGIYGPFIPSRDAVVAAVHEEEGNKAGRDNYVYVPTGPQGVYENGYGSNYHDACTYVLVVVVVWLGARSI